MLESAIRSARRLAAGILACVWVLHPAAVIAAAPSSSQSDLDRLMQQLAQRKHGEVAYAEKDYLSVLDQPLRSSGMLIYDAPDHLEKRTLEPKQESLVLDHGQLTVRRGHRTYHFDLSSYPQVAPYVDAIRATMAGDRAALERVFEVSFEGTLGHWELRLVPLDRKVARGVRSIRIDGQQDDIRSVEISQADGDRSVMTMGPAQASGR